MSIWSDPLFIIGVVVFALWALSGSLFASFVSLVVGVVAVYAAIHDTSETRKCSTLRLQGVDARLIEKPIVKECVVFR